MTTVPVPAAGLSEEDVFLGLPPELVKADKIAIVYYSFTTGLYCWDLLVTLDQDYYLVVKDRKRIRPLTVAYLVARYTILVFLVLSLLFQTTHIPDCQAMIVAIGAMYGLAQPLIASIFIARTVAVWNRNKYVIATGAAFWLLILGWSFAVPFGLFAGRIPGSKFCTNTAAKPWLTGSLASTMSNDFVMLVLLVVK
ncbi:hypothetical protein IE53DRAFT_237837 [Violaceomyces palustris]|uniref:Uncharacterized protein n=1 Tax=Violaceomyces palustris TaxID=1673888 RepID=A0ACD0NPH4_9BASI|nr:hypothetical protein IE53DRAFT_237837 [Violaceomyces palustris]